jgi:GNAT superfamily N-acetyltransferase
MQTDFSSPRLIVRPSLPTDTPDVLEFCKRIWDGEDYIPYVWDAWLADPRGQLFTAEYTGHAVGIARLTRLAPGQWWLEGFRVDPAHQDKKIGSHLHNYLTEWWLEHGEGVVRLWTNAKRVKVHHLCEKTGFVKTCEHMMHISQPLEGSGEAFQPIHAEEIPAALALIQKAESLPFTGGLMDVGWEMAAPSEALLRDFLARPDGQILWWKGGRGLLCVWDDEDPGAMSLFIGLAACAVADLPALLQDARHFAGQKYKALIWDPIVEPQLAEILAQAGFEAQTDDWNFQFELVHPSRT